jgi:Flp pilus assembly protein TadG
MVMHSSHSRICLQQARLMSTQTHRPGNVLTLFAVLLPILCGIIALVIDGGLMMRQYRDMQHSADAAATAAAVDIRLGHGASHAADTATSLIHDANGEPDATVTVSIPPVTGRFAGRAHYVEVNSQMNYKSKFARVLDGLLTRSIRTRSVAGLDDVTVGAAIMVLDPDPAATTIPSSDEILNEVPSDEVANDTVTGLNINQQLSTLGLGGLLGGLQSRLTIALNQVVQSAVSTTLANAGTEIGIPALPTLTAGMEIEGLGQLKVDGAILVNTQWGGVDENGDQVGDGQLPYAVSCMPIVSTTRVSARDIRVVGGVDRAANYQSFEAGHSSPLQANRLPVPDPFKTLPVPSTSSDGPNVSAEVHQPGDALVISIGSPSTVPTLANTILNTILAPLSPAVAALVKPTLSPVVTSLLQSLAQPPQLSPGVYNSITVISLGDVRFQPGVYVIRGTSPETQMALTIIGGSVQANGVLFYITDSASYDASTGMPDAGDNSDTSPGNPLLSSKPSAFIAPLLPGSHIAGLSDPSSPFNGMLLYQRRLDRRPIVIAATKLVGGGDISGTIYSKWGHVIFLGGAGSYDLRLVSGTLRVLTVFNTTIAPSRLLPAAQDVLLAE